MTCGNNPKGTWQEAFRRPAETVARLRPARLAFAPHLSRNHKYLLHNDLRIWPVRHAFCSIELAGQLGQMCLVRTGATDEI